LRQKGKAKAESASDVPRERAHEKAQLLERLAEREGLKDAERAVLLEAAELMKRTAPEPPEIVQNAENGSATLWTDGAARGNPGPAGLGAVLKRADDTEIGHVCRYIGRATNNVAEYRALLEGLALALQHGVRSIEVRADSELLIKQLKGEYQVRNPNLKELFVEAKLLLARFDSHRLLHVRRELNTEADRLANQAIDHGG
jgi:ribonuclease HI